MHLPGRERAPQYSWRFRAPTGGRRQSTVIIASSAYAPVLVSQDQHHERPMSSFQQRDPDGPQAICGNDQSQRPEKQGQKVLCVTVSFTLRIRADKQVEGGC